MRSPSHIAANTENYEKNYKVTSPVSMMFQINAEVLAISGFYKKSDVFYHEWENSEKHTVLRQVRAWYKINRSAPCITGLNVI